MNASQAWSPRKSLSRFALGAVLTITVLKVWLAPGSLLPAAQAQIPDSGAQRNEMIEQAKRTNQLLGDILQTLRTQPFKVELTSTDNTSATPRPAKSGGK